MNDQPFYIRLPDTFSSIPQILASKSIDSDELIVHEIEFIQKIFGYASFLRASGRETPLSDAVLTVFIQLFDVLNANSPEEAEHCTSQLALILQQVFSKPKAL